MPPPRRKPIWQYLGTLATLLLLLSFVWTLQEPIASWFAGTKQFDRDVLEEWVSEARVYRTLPELLEEYLRQVVEYKDTARGIQAKIDMIKKAQAQRPPGPATKADVEATLKLLELANQEQALKQKYLLHQDEIRAHMKAMFEPVTKVYKNQLPLFPVIYRLSLNFDRELELAPIVWDSELPRQKDQYQELQPPLKLKVRLRQHDQEVVHEVEVQMQYTLRVYTTREYRQRVDSARYLQLGSLLTISLTLVLLWFYLAQGRERDRQRQQLQAEQQVNEAERLRLQEELRRQEAERKHEEAERTNLELKTQLWANIGILAGSYAHNIKNLLVRPNDLLSRCLEADGLAPSQEHMLQEVRHTLGTVTERLQQILQTVRRDPTQAERVRLDLNELAEEMRKTWQDLSREKWKMTLTLNLSEEPLWIEGDHSHLQQAIENLLFNARDATFEMRNFLREQARQPKAETVAAGASPIKSGTDRRQALIAAASWTGTIALRTFRDGDHAVLEVSDNGIGMSDEVRRRCTETHYSTKRNNALYAGFNAGMGLGLSFIRMILEHHQAAMTIESEPYRGTTFRIVFPLSQEQAALA